MATDAIPFDASQASGLEQLAGAPPLVVNAMTDLSGCTRARPGISAWSGFPTTIPNASAVDGMIPWGNYLLYVTRDRQVLAITDGSALSLSDTTAATRLDGTSRPQLNAHRTKVVMAGGGAPQKWTGVGLTARLGGSPPIATHICAIATRLVVPVADQSGIFQWSGFGETGHETWDALNFAEAEAKPDPLKALHDQTNEIFAFGSETLQVYSPDPVLGFAPGRTVNVGLLAPYSVARIDDSFAFLDREQRFITTDGRGFTDQQNVLSKPIESTLRQLSSVTDCWGFRLRTDRWDACTWMFPTDGKGFVWDRRRNTWSEWRAWSSTTASYAAPTITSAVYWPEKALFLVGLSTGQIAKLDESAYTDLGEILRVELQSGFVDRGTDARKHCKATYFTFKRGQTTSGSAPRVLISWRDNPGAWSSPVVRDLGLAGDYHPVVQIRGAGVYRRRQWKIEFTSASEFAFVSAREDFDVLDS